MDRVPTRFDASRPEPILSVPRLPFWEASLFMETLAILVAAGRGERLGAARAKAFLEVAGQALLLRAARAFETASLVDGIVAVVPEEEVENARELLVPIAKLRGVVPGGARRQDSVLEGMKMAPDGWDGIVLVHDAARPFVPPALIDAVVAAARAHGADAVIDKSTQEPWSEAERLAPDGYDVVLDANGVPA